MLLQKLSCETPPSKAELKLLFGITLCIVIACMLLTSCATSMKPSPGGPDPLVIVACPPLTELTDPSFGATTAKLVEVGGQYNICRTAALAGKK